MKNWCASPFYQKSLRRRSDFPCCWLTNIDSQYSHDKLRNDFDNNRRSKYCSTCWISEDKGVPSKRQQDNKLLSHYSNKTLEDLYAERHKGILRSLQVTTSNLCNLACRSCGPHDSTRWYKEWNHNHIKQYKGTLEVDMTKISDNDLEHLDNLEILGGEPFIDTNHYSLLERLIAKDKTNVSLTSTTNTQQLPMPRLMELLQQFKKVKISLSIDGIGPVFEYMRWPGKWQTTLDIIEQLRLVPNFQLSVYSTISNMNAYYFDQIVEWNIKNWSMTDWTYQIVQEPDDFAPNILPDELKRIIADKFTNHKYFKFLEPLLNAVLSPCDPILLENFQNKMRTQDNFRKLDPNNFVPEIVDYLY